VSDTPCRKRYDLRAEVDRPALSTLARVFGIDSSVSSTDGEERHDAGALTTFRPATLDDGRDRDDETFTQVAMTERLQRPMWSRGSSKEHGRRPFVEVWEHEPDHEHVHPWVLMEIRAYP